MNKIHLVKIALFLAYFIIITSPLFSQQGKISGRVKDEKGKLVEDAEVLLMLNNAVINGAITDSRGEYSIIPVEPSDYYTLQVNYLNHEQRIICVYVWAGATHTVDFTLKNVQTETLLFQKPPFESMPNVCYKILTKEDLPKNKK